MTIDYSVKAARAKSILEKFGALGNVKISRSSGISDPILGDTLITTEFDLTAVDLKVSSDLIQAGLVESTDRMVIASSDTKPLMDDTIVIGSVDHKVINVMTVTPAGFDVIYKIICRA